MTGDRKYTITVRDKFGKVLEVFWTDEFKLETDDEITDNTMWDSE